MSELVSIDLLPDGVHLGIDEGLYHASSLPSASRLNRARRSLAHALTPFSVTPELEFGSAFHMYVLEPARFPDRYTILPRLNRRTKAGKAEYAAFMDDIGDRKVISQTDMETIARMAEALDRHSIAGQIIKGLEKTEITVLATCPQSGVRFKGRIDASIDATLVDLKTTKDASKDTFTRSIFNFGYHNQAWLYLYAMEILGEPIDNFLFVAVEREYPFGVQVYELSSDAVGMCQEYMVSALRKFDKAQKEGVYPSYDEQIIRVFPPKYLMEANESYPQA